MAEQQKIKDIAYSIRKRGDDEIEIRDSLFDGYARGFIRFVLGGMMFINILFNGSSVIPFYSHSDTKRDYERAFNEDKIAMENYLKYKKRMEEVNLFREDKLEITPYAEYKQGILPKSPLKDFILDIIMIPFVVFAFFLPRPRGLRINRKKRVIYWQTILGSHSIAFVPDSGDPLGGLSYSRFGLYAFGEHERFSLQLWILDYFTKRHATAWFGVYPSPSSAHNAQILRAIRAYLTEDNPEFLNDIGRDYKNFGLKFNIALCNAFALRVPFSRKKADAAIEKALTEWNKKIVRNLNHIEIFFDSTTTESKFFSDFTLSPLLYDKDDGFLRWFPCKAYRVIPYLNNRVFIKKCSGITFRCSYCISPVYFCMIIHSLETLSNIFRQSKKH